VPAVKTLRSLLAIAAFLATASTAWAAQPLLTPAELNALLGKPDVRVIDIRPPKAFAQNRIPGALSAPYGGWRGPASNPGELPDLAKLTAQVQKLGLTPATHAVVVSSGDDATDFGASARVYWTLKVLGLKELSVLNGGVDAWAAAKLPQDTVQASVAPSTYAPSLDKSLIATREDVAALQKGGSGRLVDSRPAAFFTGETRHQASLIPGTLKGAVNQEYTRWFAADSSAMLSADEVKKIAADSPVAAAGSDTVSFCNTGHWAAINWFALSEVAGKPGVKMYPGSMVDWSQGADAEQAMDNVPSRLGQLVIDFKLWAARTFN
jgi:thiosulfate/3-mercaptopyruvate sulfurtransferase